MGLDAFVRCRCWQDGKVTPPDRLAGLIVFGDGDLSLSVSWETDPDLNNYLYEWLDTSPCEHEDMDEVCEAIGNWALYRGFQRELATIGWHHFPTLHAELPNSNDGCTPSSLATAALAELELFSELATTRDVAVLYDTDTGETIWEQIHAFGGANVINEEGETGVDLDGFWIRRNGVEVFRSSEFTRLLDGKVRNLAVRSQPEGPDVHAFPVTALTNLFEASLATGNPVVWC